MGTRIPLSEVPYNNVRRNAQPQGSTHEGRLRSPKPNETGNASSLAEPSSVQSMLRNTTEIGDIGQFSIKPSRVPTAVRRPSPASSNKTRNTPSKLRQPGPYYNGNGGYHVVQNSVPSRSGSGSSKNSQRPVRGLNRAPSFEEGYRTFSMTQSSYTSHSLTHRHPYANGYDYNRTDLQTTRPRSPFAYPTRLKRPGYRPYSPSLHELSKSQAHRVPGLQRDPSSRTVSPSSGYYPTRTPSPWQHGFNRSDPMLYHYPPYIAAGPSRNRSPSLSSNRPTTPKPSSSLRSVASSSQIPRTHSVANLGRANGQPEPPLPMFYDYSEGFGEQDDYTNMSVSTAILFEQSTPEAFGNTDLGMNESPETTSPLELSTDNSPPKSSMQIRDHTFNHAASPIESIGGGWIRATGQDLSDVLEMSEKDAPSEHGEARSEHDYDDRNLRRFEHAYQQPVVSTIAESIQQVLPHEANGGQQSQPDLVRSMSVLNGSQGSNNDISPETGSIDSAKSSPRLEPEHLTQEPVDNIKDAVAPQLEINTNIVRADADAATPIEVQSAHPVESIRGPSSEGHSRAELREILSPTPERSISSSIARNRFSKILSIDENPSGVDHTESSHKKENGKDSPMQGLRKGSTIPAFVEHPWRKRSSYLRDTSIQPSPVETVFVEDSDSEEEPELTSALRATFCRNERQELKHSGSFAIDTLPSQSSARRPQTPLSIRRTPATRVSITNLPDLQESTTPVNIGKEDEALPQDLPHKDSEQGSKRPTPVDKELPPLPKDRRSIVSYSPPAQSISSALPFSFSPLVQERRDDPTDAELEAVTSSYLAYEEETAEPDNSPYTSPTPDLLPKRSTPSFSNNTPNMSPDRASGASPLSSRPWNLDTSYPWDNEIPELDVKLPPGSDESPDPIDTFPRFKFRLQRASTLGGGARRRSKRISSDNTFNTLASSDILPGPSSKPKQSLSLAIFPTNINSSHDILRSSLQRTRFVESFEEQSPTVKLIPPSPGHEVQSFFSDDSSLPRPKGSLRKRFSDFRARTSKAASMDQTRGYDRGLLSSAFGMSRASGRSSRQSERTAGGRSSRASQAKRGRFNVIQKFKTWLQPLEDRLRDWRWRMRYGRDKTRAASSTPLYDGV